MQVHDAKTAQQEITKELLYSLTKFKMKITRTHPFTGATNTLDLNITSDEWQRYLDGELVQNAMPHLNEDEREFIISGIPPGEWDKVFPFEYGG